MPMVTLLKHYPVAAQVTKSKLKARMLEIFRKLEREGGELIVTDNGRPALKIVPIRQKIPVEVLFADVRKQIAKGKIKFPSRAVLLAPMDPEDYAMDSDKDFLSISKKNKAKRKK